jgi:alanine racemase
LRRVQDIFVEQRVRPTRAEIDLDAIAHNARRIASRLAEGVGIFAVVKADAYGHGAVPVARTLLQRGGVRGLAVSLVEEGLELRAHGVAGPILVLGGAYARAHRDVLAADLTPVVSEPADVEAFAAAGAGPPRIHLKVDTGMSRLGARAETLPALLAACRTSGVEVTGLCTHLASADVLSDAGRETTRRQLERFTELARVVREHGFAPGCLHVANSAGTLRYGEAHHDAVRPGLALYGMGVALAPDLDLRPVMRFATEIVQLRTLAAGDTVSYGGLWRASQPTRVATLPVGYADGYPRRPAAGLEVLVGGRRCPVLGAVCMDMTIVDVTALGESARVGDDAVLLGAQGGEHVGAAELAARTGLIEYEITCAVSKRVPRVYKGGRS